MFNAITNFRKNYTQKNINISNSSHVLITTASTSANDINLIGKTFINVFSLIQIFIC